MGGFEHIYHSGTVQLANLAVAVERIRLPAGETIKKLIIETDGQLQFAGPIFLRCTGHFIQQGAGVDVGYTRINGRVEFGLEAPYILFQKGTEQVITITNDSGANRIYQIWVIT